MEKAYKLEFAESPVGGLTVNCCGLSKTEPLHSFGPAVKPHFLIHYILSGKGVFSIGGKQYPLEKGYGFVITPDDLAFYQSDQDDPWTYVWVGFSGRNAELCLQNMGISLQQPIFRSDRSGELYSAIKDMMEHNTYGMANELRRIGQLNLFLSIVAESIRPEENSSEDRGNIYVQKAILFIQSNYCNPIKVTDIADFVCVNRSYLYTLFQLYLQMSPQQFLMSFRITKAAELLQVTDLTVESIAISCGYGDPLVFTKAFNRIKGMSPTKYRKEIRKSGSRRDMEALAQVEEFVQKMNDTRNGK